MSITGISIAGRMRMHIDAVADFRKIVSDLNQQATHNRIMGDPGATVKYVVEIPRRHGRVLAQYLAEDVDACATEMFRVAYNDKSDQGIYVHYQASGRWPWQRGKFVFTKRHVTY